MGNAVGAAVTGEIVQRSAGALQSRVERAIAAPVESQVDRLHHLVLKLHSAAEVADPDELADAGWLLQWRDKLEHDAIEGDAVLAAFRQRQRLSPAGRLKRTRDAAFKLFSGAGDEEVERLNEMVSRLEGAGKEVADFLSAVEMNIRRSKRRRRMANVWIPPFGSWDASDGSNFDGIFQMCRESPQKWEAEDDGAAGVGCELRLCWWWPERRVNTAAAAAAAAAAGYASDDDVRGRPWLAQWREKLVGGAAAVSADELWEFVVMVSLVTEL